MQRKSKLPISYNVAIEGKRQILVDWGNTPGWLETYREDLDNAHRISLIPKEGQPIPVVSVILDGSKRWIVGSRVCGRVNKGTGEGSEIRIYFIGWQQTIGNINVKSIHWVYPGGAVECADEPMLVDHFLNGAKVNEEKAQETQEA
jgi:hypothetical protein